MSETCRSCGAPLLWAKTPKGKRMPIDAEPVENGNVHLIAVKPGDSLEAVIGANGTHVAHFVTCPQAKQHRKV